jgi:hypothetical protein
MLEMQVVGRQFIGKPGSLAKEVAPAQRLFCLLVGNHHRLGIQIGPEIVVMGIASLNAILRGRTTLRWPQRFCRRLLKEGRPGAMLVIVERTMSAIAAGRASYRGVRCLMYMDFLPSRQLFALATCLASC